MIRTMTRLGALVVLCVTVGCRQDEPAAAPSVDYRVVQTFPHDPAAFTQGLVIDDGVLFESTGLYGRSSLRRVDLTTGRVLQQVRLPDRYFGEGCVVVDDRIYQLTWRAGVGFIFDRVTLQHIGEFTYSGEGWGLTYDGARLVMSDGTARLRFLSTNDFAVVRQVEVTRDGQPLTGLNELEWIEGEVWANVFRTDTVVRIDPGSGEVVDTLDFAGLLTPELRQGRRVDVLNGIAYDAATQRLFLTGKLWPVLFEVEVVP
jgi:glutaminyl-peptide cyclotransferase